MAVVLVVLDNHKGVLVLDDLDAAGLQLRAHGECASSNFMVGDETGCSVDAVLELRSACGTGEKDGLDLGPEHVALGDVVRSNHVDTDTAGEGRGAQGAEQTENGVLAHGVLALAWEGNDR